MILLSNLLDNAIRESEKVLKNTGKAVIHLKLECEEHKLIFAVRNPVTEKVEIENDTIKSKRTLQNRKILRKVQKNMKLLKMKREKPPISRYITVCAFKSITQGKGFR